MDSHVVTQLWTVPAEQVPPPDRQEARLYDLGQEIDDWIGLTLAESTTADEAPAG